MILILIFRLIEQSQSRAPLPPILSESESGTESEINISKKNKRTSSFVDNWKTNQDWLVYVEGEGMYCTACQKANKHPFDRDTWNKTHLLPVYGLKR